MNTTTGVAAAAMIAFSAFGVTAFGPGIAGGMRHSTGHPATFQMYADVDQAGTLGSQVGVTSVTENTAGGVSYNVRFNRPIGTCAAQVQPGFASGSHGSWFDTSVVSPENSTSLWVEFWDPAKNTLVPTSFMLTVTCQS